MKDGPQKRKIIKQAKDWKWRIAKAGKTQRDFAKDAGVTNALLSQYTRGIIVPSPLTIMRIEKKLAELKV